MLLRSIVFSVVQSSCLYCALSLWVPIQAQDVADSGNLQSNLVDISKEDDGVPIDYLTQVKPLLSERCIACHGALKQEAGLRLDTALLAVRGGQSGAAIVPGDTSRSLLLQRIQSDDLNERMPPDGESLKPNQIRLIKNWIAQDAFAPSNERSEEAPSEHWAFKLPVKSEIPESKLGSPYLGSMNVNPIDILLSSEHEKQGLTFHHVAEPGILLRRVSIDLVGLPPTLAEIEAFNIDNSKDAYEKVVQRLLDSPQYGERWGRHWMDVWRYSDWWGLGNEVRNSQKHMWHWRDWIIESLNENKGYDQMLREMLAADEMYPNDLDRLRASGYLARQYFKFNRTSWLDGVIEHTAKAMLGLTFNCAKCHDHKYDPISQVDYYQFRAIFEPYQIRTEFVPGEIDPDKNGISRAFDCNLDTKTFLHIRGDDRNPDNTKQIEPAIPLFFTGIPLDIKPIALPIEARHPGLRPFVMDSFQKSAKQKIETAKAAILNAAKKLRDTQAMVEQSKINQQNTDVTEENPNPESDKTFEREITKANLELLLAEKALMTAEAIEKDIAARSLADKARALNPLLDITRSLAMEASRLERLTELAKAQESVIAIEYEAAVAASDKRPELETKRLNAIEKLEKIQKSLTEKSARYTPIPGAVKTRESNVESDESNGRPFPGTSTGRRSAFANWLTDSKNPLTARVAVNHIWMRHMGRPLVATTFDFGRKGLRPTHPQLLDWLAIELVESGWDMKHIHRLIVTSQAYKSSSSNAFATPENVSRDPDNLHYWRANSIRLDSQSIRDSLLYLAGDLDLRLGGPSINASDEKANRRSLYFVHSHNEHNTFLSMFDDANVLDCYRRAESVVPQQALALENSSLVATVSKKIALRIGSHVEAEKFARIAFLNILCIEPSDRELDFVLKALEELTTLAIQNKRDDPALFARQQIIHALLNHNDFITAR